MRGHSLPSVELGCVRMGTGEGSRRGTEPLALPGSLLRLEAGTAPRSPKGLVSPSDDQEPKERSQVPKESQDAVIRAATRTLQGPGWDLEVHWPCPPPAEPACPTRHSLAPPDREEAVQAKGLTGVHLGLLFLPFSPNSLQHCPGSGPAQALQVQRVLPPPGGTRTRSRCSSELGCSPTNVGFAASLSLQSLLQCG